MGYKIYDDGAVIKIDNGSSILLVTKSQVKTIDTIANGFVRLDIGKGPLENVFIKWSDVEDPVVGSAENLRDSIKNMMLNLSEEAGIITELTNIKNVLTQLKLSEADLLKTEPSRTDESQPNTLYKGWHSGRGIPDNNEWAILRITRTADNVIYEWAGGNTRQVNVWNNHLSLVYYPLDYIGPIPAPLPA